MNDMQGPVSLRIAAVFYLVLGVYVLVFPSLYDTSLFSLYVVGALSILCGVGVLLLKKWALWGSTLLFPVMLALSSVTLFYSSSMVGFYPDWKRALFHLSLMLYLVLTILALLMVVDKRREFK